MTSRNQLFHIDVSLALYFSVPYSPTSARYLIMIELMPSTLQKAYKHTLETIPFVSATISCCSSFTENTRWFTWPHVPTTGRHSRDAIRTWFQAHGRNDKTTRIQLKLYGSCIFHCFFHHLLMAMSASKDCAEWRYCHIMDSHFCKKSQLMRVK